MDVKPDTIKVCASSRSEISSSHANLFVTVRGSSVVSGNEAMKKAREVSQLVDELVRFGLPADKIYLQGVHVETSSGGLLKSSSAVYRLRLRCDELEKIPGLLDIIASQKNAALERIDWKYPEEEARQQGLEVAMERAKAKAEKVAASLGVRLLGVYDFVESSFDEEPPVPFQAQTLMMKAQAERAVEAPSLGMDIQHSKTIHVNVEIWYRVSEF